MAASPHVILKLKVQPYAFDSSRPSRITCGLLLLHAITLPMRKVQGAACPVFKGGKAELLEGTGDGLLEGADTLGLCESTGGKLLEGAGMLLERANGHQPRLTATEM
jgi:hypothetical protein